MPCGCEFANVGDHTSNCALAIPLIKRLEAAKEKSIKSMDFEGAAAIRDAIYFIRKVRAESPVKPPA